MKIVWWLPIPEWRDWAQRLLDYGFYAQVHCDQNLLLAGSGTKRFDSTSINCDILIIDRETFPIPDGYVEYDSTNDVYRIYFWTAFQDLMSILRSKGIILANTGGMFGWYLCTRKGLIPSDRTSVQVEYPWGWETVDKQSSWDGKVEQTQDMWNVGNRTQRALYYYINGTDPGTEIQEFTDGLYAPLPFTGLVYSVPRALKVETPDISVQDVGFTPLVVRDYDHPSKGAIKVAVTGINFSCPIMIYGISFGSQYDAINVIIDLMTGLTSVQNFSVIYRPPIEVVDMLDEPINFAYAWAGPTHLKFLFKVRNRGRSKVVLSLVKLIENDLFVKLDKSLVRYIDRMDLVEETERSTLDAWTQVDTNTWRTTFSTAQDFSCDFDAGVVRLLLIKLNVSDFVKDTIIRLRAYTTDTDYYIETRTLWNWHCYKPGTFWLTWAICAVPQSRYGGVVGNPDVTNIAKVEVWIDNVPAVTVDTSQPPIKVTYQRVPVTRRCIFDRGSYLLLTFWDSDGNFNLDPNQERSFILTIRPTPLLDAIKAVRDAMPYDPRVSEIYDSASSASFYFEVQRLYRELLEYLDSKGTDSVKKVRDLLTLGLMARH